MINVLEHVLYQEDIAVVAESKLPWEKLKNSSVLISGARGMIGSALIDVIMYRNQKYDMSCKIYALGRDEEKAKERFSYCWNSQHFTFVLWDINEPLEREDMETVDYVLHLASNTHPVAYATDPIGTITTNIIGTRNMLEFAAKHNSTRGVFASSNEIYGENRGDIEQFDEAYCGYIDCNTMRAGYPESKRCGEALCQAYIKQKKVDVVIPRFTRSYGPTMLMSDTKAISQFIRKGIVGEDIVLKSEGNQHYSYTYVSDAVTGLLTVWFCGMCGEAYNIADEASDIRLKDLATLIAEVSGRKVIYELPDSVENAGYSRATKARLESGKLKALGWKANYDIKSGIVRTLTILKDSK
ncbi:MAG: NAD-dependent epimerase/dehydratase family protein [Lachnospiraceae bacterium]|jgi:UDP-glucuronate decarboxylase|nr:NAD-dependent epimerase/dehydratase family protein [Lachnospiraceae bacterium]